MSLTNELALAKTFDKSSLAYCVIRVLVDDNGAPYDWEFLYLNDALAKIEGKTKEELLNHRFFEVFPDADPKWFDYYYPAAYEGKSFTFEEISDEIGLYLKIRCFPIEYGYCGCILENVKENYDTNSVVNGLSRDFSTVWLVHVPEMSMQLIQKAGTHVVQEELELAAEAKFYGTRMKEYILQHVVEEDRDRVFKETSQEVVIEQIKSDKFYKVTYRANYQNEIAYFQMNFVSVNNSNNFVLGFRNVNDVMKEQQKQEKALKDALMTAEHANRAKSTFLNNMSHDIRTPMNAIIGFTALAASHIDDKEIVRDYLGKIQISSNHLLSLINDVLDMSRIESGKLKIEEKEVHLPEVFHDLRTIVQSDITAKQIDFFIDTVDVVNEDVICDRLRLNQILLNIFSNAMKFTEPGGIISVRVIQKPALSGKYADYEFRIKDNGIGMSREFQEHIFEAFSRERTATVSGIQGTGLGMAITKNIVDMMGGTITVHSEVGKGSEFVVNLRFKISGEKVRFDELEELKGLRALVVDDDTNTCMSICSMLSSIGMRTEWSASGKEAVVRTEFAINQKDEFHAYIIDWLMPDMNGIEVVRRIRRIIGETKPIIILTAYDWADIEEEAKEAGVTAFCSKPLFMSELYEVLSKPLQDVAMEEQQDEEFDYNFDGKRILLVEDNELNREIAVEILEDVGFHVETAVDGDIAVEMIYNSSEKEYDLVLMDIQMPKMDGYEATRQIRQLSDSSKATIPIVAMTANAFEEDKQEAIAVGMNGFITKPIEITKVMELLEDILKEDKIQEIS